MDTAVKHESGRKIGRFFVAHGMRLAALLFLLLFYRCPIRYFLGVPCPGCGITRAHLAIMSLDVKAALRCHPLFFTVLPALLYIPHRNIFRRRLSDTMETILFVTIIAMFLVVYIFRMFNGLII